MLDLLKRYREDGQTIGTPEMIEFLRAASISKEYQGTTE